MNSPSRTQQQPILRFCAWVAVFLLILGWACVAAQVGVVKYDVHLANPNALLWVYFPSQFGAFVVGLMSCQRLGALAGGLALLTVFILFLYLLAHLGD